MYAALEQFTTATGHFSKGQFAEALPLYEAVAQAASADEPILEVKATRGYGTVGASWFGVRRTRLATELYYAPGSALTVRALAGVHLW